MEVDQIITRVTEFIRGYPLLAGAVVVGVLVCLYRSPKETLKFLIFLTVLAVAGYCVLQFTSTTSTGVGGKEELLHKTERALGE